MTATDQPTPATCDLCDRFLQDTPAGFRVLPPVFKAYGGRRRFAGTVATVQCFEDNSMVKAAAM